MIYLIFAGLIIWGGSQVARGFFVGLGLLPDHSFQTKSLDISTTVANGHCLTDFENDLPTTNFSTDILYDDIEDGVPSGQLEFGNSQLSSSIPDGAGFYSNIADAASHGATCQVGGDDGGMGFYM